MRPIRTRWAIPARRSCALTARWKPATIRVPMAARQASRNARLNYAAVRDSVAARMHTILRNIVTLGFLVAASAAQAHPHVWVTIQSEVLYAPDGKAVGVRHAWKFDDMFSAFAVQGIEAK